MRCCTDRVYALIFYALIFYSLISKIVSVLLCRCSARETRGSMGRPGSLNGPEEMGIWRAIEINTWELAAAQKTGGVASGGYEL